MAQQPTFTTRAYNAHGACFAAVTSSAGHEFTILRRDDETPAAALRRYAREERQRAAKMVERAATYEAAAEQATA